MAIAEIARFNPDQRHQYLQSVKYYRDISNVVSTSFAEGEAQGEARGEEKKARQIALRLLADCFTTEQIARITGLTLETIESLKL